MTSSQLQQLDQRLSQWRANHANTVQVREAYRQQVVRFTLSSMALENEPVNPQRLAQLLSQPAR
jgi:nitrogen fixation protein FixH